TKSDVWVIDRAGGEPECRSASLSVGVDGALQADMPVFLGDFSVRVSADGKCAYVRVQEGGTVQIYEVALEGAESYKPLLTGERSCHLVGVDKRHLLFIASDFNHPIDLYVANPDGSRERQLTHINDEWIKQVKLP